MPSYPFLTAMTLQKLFNSCSFAEEDAYSTYSTFLVKYFLSEGIMSGHELFVSNGKEDPRKIVNVRVHRGEGGV